MSSEPNADRASASNGVARRVGKPLGGFKKFLLLGCSSNGCRAATDRTTGLVSALEQPEMGRTKQWEEGAMAGLKERMAGRFMQWEGKVTGDPIRRMEGKLVAVFGRLKRAVGNVRRRRASRRGDTAAHAAR